MIKVLTTIFALLCAAPLAAQEKGDELPFETLYVSRIKGMM